MYIIFNGYTKKGKKVIVSYNHDDLHIYIEYPTSGTIKKYNCEYYDPETDFTFIVHNLIANGYRKA